MAEKKAVVLAGGGSRGAYQIGAWKALRELDYHFTMITGTSVGALNGAVMTLGDYALGERIWSQITTERIFDYTPEGDISTPQVQKKVMKSFVKKVVKDHSIDQAPLKELLEQTLDVDRIYASDIDFGLVAMTYPALKPALLFKEQIPKEHFIDFLMASSAFFPAMKPYRIKDETYIDGGFYDTVPIRMAAERGAEEIVVIDLKAIGLRKKLKDKDAKIRIIKVAPKEDLGFTMLFDADLAKTNIQRGYLDTMKAFGVYTGWYYTFRPEDYRTKTLAFHKFCWHIAEEIIPRTKTGAAFQKHITGLLLRKLVRATSADLVEEGWLIPAADLTGRIFEISPLRLYDKASFDLEVLRGLQAAAETAPPCITSSEDDTDLITFIKALTDEKVLVLLILCELRALLAKTSSRRFVQVAAEIAPGPAAAGLYCLFSEMRVSCPEAGDHTQICT